MSGATGAVDVDPYDIYVAAKAFADGSDKLSRIVGKLSEVLLGCGGMAGDDQGGKQFGTSYDPAAGALVNTLTAAVPLVSSMGSGLVATANNYLKAECHSTTGARGEPGQFPVLGVWVGMSLPNPPSAVGHGSALLPGLLAKYWVNGSQGKLRAAADAFRTAAEGIQDVGLRLSNAVSAITDNNSSASIDAMAAFFAQVWQEGPASRAPLTSAMRGCTELARLCEGYAEAIDQQHSAAESKLADAGVSIGGISLIGGLLSEVSFGASDDLAAQLGRSAAAALLDDTLRSFLSSISVLVDPGFWESLVEILEKAASGTPLIEVETADTSPVASVLDEEMTQTEMAERRIVEEDSGPNSPLAHADFDNPKKFDANILRGESVENIERYIPKDWIKTSAKRGGGVKFRDPRNFGRQIRIMPGYPAGSRADPVTWGPYAVVSQNGAEVKIPLEGNPTIGDL